MEKYIGSWGKNQVQHLLKRTMFGAKKSDVEYFLTKTLDQTIDELLMTLPESVGPLKNYTDVTAERFPNDPDLNVAIGQTWVNYPTTNSDIHDFRRNSIRRWWMGKLINQNRNITEKMVVFWANHFSVSMDAVHNSSYFYNYIKLVRNFALGNFKILTRDMSINNGMLSYLNGNDSSKTAPDENYARELQELFTLGKENIPNYTEDDVKAAAKVLTGWRNKSVDATVYFNLNEHDTTDKQFSSFYGNKIIKGRNTTDGGFLELQDLIDMIFSKSNEVSKFIVRKLYRYFVYYDITSSVETEIITPLAQIFVQNNWEIKPVLKELLTSNHFYSDSVQSCYIKTPFDLVVGTIREFEFKFSPQPTVTQEYHMYNNLVIRTRQLNQAIGDPPDVSGWKAFYQKPMYHELWISSDTVTKRNLFAKEVVETGYGVDNISYEVNLINFVKTFSNPSDPNVLINEALSLLHRIQFSQESKNKLKTDFLLSGQMNDYYWTEAWAKYIANPGDIYAFYTVQDRLVNLFKYITSIEEYQLI